MRHLPHVLGLVLLSGASAAAEPDRVVTSDERAVVDALLNELQREGDQLSLPSTPPIYHLRFKLLDLASQSATASRGALIDVAARPVRLLGAEVRVGSASYDNTGFGGWRDGFGLVGLTATPDPLVARLDAWRLVDGLFKDAVEQYSRKEAQAVLSPDHPGDYTLIDGAPWVSPGLRSPIWTVPSVPAPAPGAARQLALDVSAGMADARKLEVSRVDVGDEAGLAWMVDSEGVRMVRAVQETSVRATAWWITPDGGRLADQRLWTGRTVADLPSADQMAAEAGRMALALEALAAAPRLTEEYVGPVVFEDQAAADLFRWLLLPQVLGTPPQIPFDSFLGDIGAGRDGARMLRRVLPQGWTVTDDPTADPGHPGAYTVDAEGVPARPVTVVRDGIVRELLMSRVPRKDGAGSNGHARGRLADRASGMPSLTDVEAPGALSLRALHRRALRAAAAYGLDHVLVVRRLQLPGLAWLDDPQAWMRDDADTLPAPVAVYRLFADGREEQVRGARFSAVDRRVLRDLIAAGPRVTMDYMSASDGDDGGLGPIEGTPCRMRAPAVVVGELELVPMPLDASRAPRLPPPG